MTSSTMRPSLSEKLADKQLDDKQTGIFLLLGISLIILGVLSIAFSVLYTIGTVLFVGVLLIAAGIGECVHAAHRKSDAFFSFLCGLLYLSVGGILLFNPLAGAVSLTLVMSAYFIAAGIFRSAYAIQNRMRGCSGLFLSGAIIDIIMGCLIAMGWPLISFWVIGLFVGIEMLMAGIAYVALSAHTTEIRQAII
jgi:uncharacterized membrane protein HdeD (DUF308 family)